MNEQILYSFSENNINIITKEKKVLTTDLIYFLSASNGNKTGSPTTNPDITAMMLMFCGDSKSDSRIKRSMGMI